MRCKALEEECARLRSDMVRLRHLVFHVMAEHRYHEQGCGDCEEALAVVALAREGWP